MAEGAVDRALARLVRTAESLTGRRSHPDIRRQFQRYLDLLVRWNRVQRLTAIRSPAAIVSDLFEDSILFYPLLPLSRPLSVLDIGSGSGIPGVPLRIVDPSLALTMIEARQKRVSFLRTLVRELDLDGVRVLEGRAESLVGELLGTAGPFDVCVARAVAPGAQLLSLAKPYLRPGGLVLTSPPPTITPAKIGPEWRIERVGQRRLLVATA